MGKHDQRFVAQIWVWQCDIFSYFFILFNFIFWILLCYLCKLHVHLYIVYPCLWLALPLNLCSTLCASLDLFIPLDLFPYFISVPPPPPLVTSVSEMNSKTVDKEKSKLKSLTPKQIPASQNHHWRGSLRMEHFMVSLAQNPIWRNSLETSHMETVYLALTHVLISLN